jgi:hypothetical protein
LAVRSTFESFALNLRGFNRFEGHDLLSYVPLDGYAFVPESVVLARYPSIRYLLFIGRVDSPVFLFVGPLWEALDHSGTITDRGFPGTLDPCPFLDHGSEFCSFIGASCPIQWQFGFPFGKLCIAIG